jgi:hypothetical protein
MRTVSTRIMADEVAIEGDQSTAPLLARGAIGRLRSSLARGRACRIATLRRTDQRWEDAAAIGGECYVRSRHPEPLPQHGAGNCRRAGLAEDQVKVIGLNSRRRFRSQRGVVLAQDDPRDVQGSRHRRNQPFSPMPLMRVTGELTWSTTNFSLTAIPFYLIFGEILLRSGIAGRMYTALVPWASWLPGGLTHSNVAACALFGSVSGSSVATAATIGVVAMGEIDSTSPTSRCSSARWRRVERLAF